MNTTAQTSHTVTEGISNTGNIEIIINVMRYTKNHLLTGHKE